MLDKHYDFKNQEPNIYQHWEDIKAFTPKINNKKKPFTIIMPPPNANGSLHIGHAMFVTLQDIMIRFNRMKGIPSLWVPGADHAGILTQVVYERELKKKKLTRYKVGRDKFVEQCFDFTQKNKKFMYSQIKRLGASLDWSRETFTLDDHVSKQVINTFVQLYNDHLIYRGERLVNWCPRCMTALSNLEVEHHEEVGKIYHIMYPLVAKAHNTGQTRFIVVATTRPETMLGDTAIAVHPDDRRYKQFIGKKIMLPIVNREIPIVADDAVDPKFGTGAVKVTPAHDPVDFEIGQRHKLDSIQIIDFRNKMTQAAGEEFVGLKIDEARAKVLKMLKSKRLLIQTKKHVHQVGHCERCKTTIQPQISKQWFIKIKPLAKPAVKAVKDKKITFIPARFEKTFYQWMDGIHDWCISRQLWWGHRIPVYYCGTKGLSDLHKKMNPDLVKDNENNQGCGHIMVSNHLPEKCPKCGNTHIIQDPDTLDTWFSSGQWPYTTLSKNSKFADTSKGKPILQDANKNSDFNYFYPTSVMETGYEILFFWVARMIMLGIYRTGKIPFETVYLHGLVRDAFGEKMSKSKGNVVDPLDAIEKFGSDALRMSLIVGATPGNDISIGEHKIKGYRNFTNKLWNIARFIEMNIGDKDIPWYSKDLPNMQKGDVSLIKELNELIISTTKYIEDYKFSLAGEQLYNFAWHSFADKYIEESKQRIKSGDIATLVILRHTLIMLLKLLHPYIPFVTEAIWQQIPGLEEKNLITASWPKPVAI